MYFVLFFRERLAEIHDEYEERERRWNRIASILDREDLINISTITTAIDSNNRSKPTTIESTNDLTLMSKTNR